MIRLFVLACGVLILAPHPTLPQTPGAVNQKEIPFNWVNDFPKGKYPGLRHGTFRSASMNIDVGYCIYLPPGYDDPANK